MYIHIHTCICVCVCIYMYTYILEISEKLTYFWLHWIFDVFGRLSLIVVQGFLSFCGPQAFENMGSIVLGHRLSHPVACGILVP